MKSFYQILTMLSVGVLALFVLFEGAKKAQSTDDNAQMEFLVPSPVKTVATTVKDEEEFVFRCKKEIKTEVVPEPAQSPQLFPSKVNE